ncbi:MAG: Xaa-Pro dipeptidase [Alphaproteobacteria bacterium]|nr:MAG: Xaa-Pro dipeptidase [Alphaproteobacteria bacterium]
MKIFYIIITLAFFATQAKAASMAKEAAADQWTVIHAGTLLAVPGKKPRKKQSIIIHNDRIDSVIGGFVDVSGVGNGNAKLIDLSDEFVLPGLIDAHDHITAKPNRNKRNWITTKTDADQALYGAYYAKLTLLAGFTSIRNIGSTGTAIYALKDAVRAGLVPGPRIQAAGAYITITGGHGDKSTGFRNDLFKVIDHDGICDGADDCRRAVRYQIKKGSDLIKVMVTGGVNSEAKTGVGQHFTDEELVAMVTAAHMLGRKIAGHAHAAAGVNAALRAGFDSIEHGAFLDDESIRLFKEKDAYLVTTLSVGDHVLQIANDPDSGMSEGVRVKAREAIPTMMANAAKAYKAGVKIAFGTDSGEPEHGRNADEFLFLVRIGLSEADAIVTATINAADLMGVSDEVGTIEAGKYADVISTGSSPLNDISQLQHVRFVMKGGKVYKFE